MKESDSIFCIVSHGQYYDPKTDQYILPCNIKVTVMGVNYLNKTRELIYIKGKDCYNNRQLGISLIEY